MDLQPETQEGFKEWLESVFRKIKEGHACIYEMIADGDKR